MRRTIHRVLLRRRTNPLVDEQHIRIHHGEDAVVSVCCGLGAEKDALTLTWCNARVAFVAADDELGLHVSAVDFYGGHGVLIKQKRMARVITRTDNVHIIRGIRLNMYLRILTQVDEGADWIWGSVRGGAGAGLVLVD